MPISRETYDFTLIFHQVEGSRNGGDIQHNSCLIRIKVLFLHHYRLVMAQTKTILLPRQQRLLAKLGENIRLARLRRDLSAEQVAERAGIGRSTLTRLEQGNEGVSINIYIKVLTVLGLDGDIAKVAEDDNETRNRVVIC